MSLIIYDSQIPDLLVELAQEFKLYVPVEKDLASFSGQYIWKEYEKSDRLALLYPLTVASPKEFLLPSKDVLFEYDKEEIKKTKSSPQIIFGLSLVDLLAVERLGKVFETPVTDLNFKERRDKTVLVAVDKLSPPQDIEFDVYLQEIGDGVFASFAGSKLGKKIISKKYFENHKVKTPKIYTKKDSYLSDPDLSQAVAKSKNHPIWEELTKTCFGCGICSYVCPLCYCFDTSFEIDFCNNQQGTKCRNWSSCLLKDFAAVNSCNYREELKNRIYNWYFHKFVRMPSEYGFEGCVDCNRCIVYCPAKINYQKVLRTVLNDYKKRTKK